MTISLIVLLAMGLHLSRSTRVLRATIAASAIAALLLAALAGAPASAVSHNSTGRSAVGAAVAYSSAYIYDAGLLSDSQVLCADCASGQLGSMTSDAGRRWTLRSRHCASARRYDAQHLLREKREVVATNTAGSGHSALKINITEGGLTHVFDRHLAGGPLSAGKSLFNDNVTITRLIADAGDAVAPVTQRNGNLAQRRCWAEHRYRSRNGLADEGLHGDHQTGWRSGYGLPGETIAMAYTILLRTNSGTVVRQLIDEDDVMTELLPPVDDPDFPYLSRIDPYDDTLFTPLQMRRLLPELRRLRELTLNPPEFLERVEELAEECMEATHVKLQFVGD